MRSQRERFDTPGVQVAPTVPVDMAFVPVDAPPATDTHLEVREGSMVAGWAAALIGEFCHAPFLAGRKQGTHVCFVTVGRA